MKITIELSDAIVAALQPAVDRHNEHSRENHSRLKFSGEFKPCSARTLLPIFAECALIELADQEIFKRDVVKQCSWCRRFEGATRFHLLYETDFTEAQRKNFTHGICPQCLRTVEKERARVEALIDAADAIYSAGASADGRINPAATSSALPPVSVQSTVLCTA